MRRNPFAIGIFAGALAIIGCYSDISGGTPGSEDDPGAVSLAEQYAYPLSLSDDGRYFVDQNGVPVLMHGDTAWSLIGELTREEATQYLDDCAAREFNSLIVTLVDGYYVSTPPRNAYGVAPFTTPGKFTTPNEAYFEHADWVIEEAAARGIQILLAPVYLGCCSDGWFQQVRDNNSVQDMRTFGAWVGNRYKDTPNLMFHWGNDVFPEQFPQVQEKIRAMAEALRSVDGVHLMTYHGHPGASAHDVWNFTQESWLDFNATYTYDPVWQKCEADYAFSPTTPFILFESLYENEYGTSGKQQRVQAYQALLSGAAGQFYGNSPIWHMGVLGGDWRAALSDPGRVSLIHLRHLFESRAWYDLVPDRNRTALTAGHSSDDDRASAALTKDGATLIVYAPSRRTLTVNLDALSGSDATAWWFNPRDGSVDAGTPLASSGSRTFTPPTADDWVLVIDDSKTGFGPPGTEDLAPPTPPVDSTPPEIVSAAVKDGHTVSVLFSEPLDEVSAETVGNYAIDQSVAITSASLQSDQVTVELSTTDLTESVTYTLTVSNVMDKADIPNSIVASSSVQFRHFAITDVVGWYRFDSDNGGLIVDHSGHGNDGVCIVGVSCPRFVSTDGQPPGAYDFAGSGRRVGITNETAFDFTNTFSIVLWMKVNNWGSRGAHLFGKGSSSWSLTRAGRSRRLQFNTSTGGYDGYDALVGNTDVDDGQWHHVAAVYDGQQKQLYIDGQIDAETSYSSTLRTNDVPPTFGVNPGRWRNDYDGLLDDVRVYDRALSANEIVALRNYGTPPEASIQLPASGALFRAGDVLTFAGSGSDNEDGNLTPQSMSWVILFHHNGQTDQVLSLHGANEGSLTVPTTGIETSGSIEYEVVLTVTDSDGLTNVASRPILPERVDITLDTVPSGLGLSFDGSDVATPYVANALVGYQHQIGAPDSVSGTDRYTFAAWSDGGAPTHVITIPETPTTYVAEYQPSVLDPLGDEDGDGLLNGWESDFGLDPWDPTDATNDGDSDGLDNLQEQSLGTDPTVADTDGDGAADGDEVSAGTDPLDPGSTPPPASDPIDPDLIGWYRFDTNNNGLIIDYSGNGYDGICIVEDTCPAFTDDDGQPAGSYDFSGNGNYIDLPNESRYDFTSDFSVALWMKANDLGGTWAQLVGKGDSTWCLERAAGSNRLQFTTWSPELHELVGQTSVDDGQWHHVAIVYDGSRKVLYIDGQVDAQSAYSRTLNTNNIRVRMGFNTEYPSAEFSGLLDDVRIYERPLSQAEVQQIRNLPSP